MKWAYDIAALIGLVMLGVGVGFAVGWAFGLAVSGGALIAVATISARAGR